MPPPGWAARRSSPCGTPAQTVGPAIAASATTPRRRWRWPPSRRASPCPTDSHARRWRAIASSRRACRTSSLCSRAPDELAALNLAASTVRLEGSEATEALWKLGGAPTEPGGPVQAGAGPLAEVAIAGGEHLGVLFGAIGERRSVRFGYRGDPRTVDPARLSFRNGFWYLAGFDRDRQADRLFRLDRLTSAPEAGPPAAFERTAAPGPADLPPPWQMGDEDEVVAELWVDGSQAAWVAGRVGTSGAAEWGDDGSAVVRVRVRNREAFRAVVLRLLDHAELLGPPELRPHLAAWLRAVASAGANA